MTEPPRRPSLNTSNAGLQLGGQTFLKYVRGRWGSEATGRSRRGGRGRGRGAPTEAKDILFPRKTKAEAGDAPRPPVLGY